jgi:hypothetical protein
VVNFDVVDRPELELPGEFCRVELADAGKVYDALSSSAPTASAISRRTRPRAASRRSDVFGKRFPRSALGRQLRQGEGAVRLDPDLQLARRVSEIDRVGSVIAAVRL